MGLKSKVGLVAAKAPAIGISYKDFTLGIVTDGNGPVPVLVRQYALYDQDRIVRYDGLNC